MALRHGRKPDGGDPLRRDRQAAPPPATASFPQLAGGSTIPHGPYPRPQPHTGDRKGRHGQRHACGQEDSTRPCLPPKRSRHCYSTGHQRAAGRLEQVRASARCRTPQGPRVRAELCFSGLRAPRPRTVARRLGASCSRAHLRAGGLWLEVHGCHSQAGVGGRHGEGFGGKRPHVRGPRHVEQRSRVGERSERRVGRRPGRSGLAWQPQRRGRVGEGGTQGGLGR